VTTSQWIYNMTTSQWIVSIETDITLPFQLSSVLGYFVQLLFHVWQLSAGEAPWDMYYTIACLNLHVRHVRRTLIVPLQLWCARWSIVSYGVSLEYQGWRWSGELMYWCAATAIMDTTNCSRKVGKSKLWKWWCVLQCRIVADISWHCQLQLHTGSVVIRFW